MKKIGIFFVISLSMTSSANYLSIIKMDKAEIGGFTDETTTTEWANLEKVCYPDLLPEDVYFNTVFQQTNDCVQIQEREIIVTRNFDSGGSEEISRTSETQEIELPDEIQFLTGIHLENSCNDIIVNNYGNTDGIYTVGSDSDNFQVYCDMRTNEGWTLIAKSPVGDTINAAAENLDWFVNGQFESLILNPNFSYNERMSSLGVDKIRKLNHTNLSEIQVIAEHQDQAVSFYKSIVDNNLDHWFKTTEPTATTVCTNKNMTANCEASAFEYWSNRYWLRGVDLRKYGFSIIDEVVQDVHYSRTISSLSPTLCSVTGNLNNNAWHDTAADGHWGNGLIIYIK